ncbi:MAG: helix-turn-helix transcriptional regulator, partial [Smithella sp.]
MSLKKEAKYFEDFFKKQMKNKEFREAYEAETLREIFAEQLTGARKKRHLTQQGLAKIVNMPQQEISRIEKGEQNVTTDMIGRLLAGMQAKIQIHIG